MPSPTLTDLLLGWTGDRAIDGTTGCAPWEFFLDNVTTSEREAWQVLVKLMPYTDTAGYAVLPYGSAQELLYRQASP